MAKQERTTLGDLCDKVNAKYCRKGRPGSPKTCKSRSHARDGDKTYSFVSGTALALATDVACTGLSTYIDISMMRWLVHTSAVGLIVSHDLMCVPYQRRRGRKPLSMFDVIYVFLYFSIDL